MFSRLVDISGHLASKITCSDQYQPTSNSQVLFEFHTSTFQFGHVLVELDRDKVLDALWSELGHQQNSSSTSLWV
jgi:hypothetical protein